MCSSRCLRDRGLWYSSLCGLAATQRIMVHLPSASEEPGTSRTLTRLYATPAAGEPGAPGGRKGPRGVGVSPSAPLPVTWLSLLAEQLTNHVQPRVWCHGQLWTPRECAAPLLGHPGRRELQGGRKELGRKEATGCGERAGRPVGRPAEQGRALRPPRHCVCMPASHP